MFGLVESSRERDGAAVVPDLPPLAWELCNLSLGSGNMVEMQFRCADNRGAPREVFRPAVEAACRDKLKAARERALAGDEYQALLAARKRLSDAQGELAAAREEADEARKAAARAVRAEANPEPQERRARHAEGRAGDLTRRIEVLGEIVAEREAEARIAILDELAREQSLIQAEAAAEVSRLTEELMSAAGPLALELLVARAISSAARLYDPTAEAKI